MKTLHSPPGLLKMLLSAVPPDLRPGCRRALATQPSGNGALWRAVGFPSRASGTQQKVPAVRLAGRTLWLSGLLRTWECQGPACHPKGTGEGNRTAFPIMKTKSLGVPSQEAGGSGGVWPLQREASCSITKGGDSGFCEPER